MPDELWTEILGIAQETGIKIMPKKKKYKKAKWLSEEDLQIHEHFMKLSTRKTNAPIKKWAKELNRRLSKEDIQMANKQVKRCSISLL